MKIHISGIFSRNRLAGEEMSTSDS